MSKLERIVHDDSNGLDYILVGEIYSLLQPKTKVKVVNEIKEKARPSIMSRLAEKKKELAEREANKKNDLKKSWNRDDR